MMEIGVSCPKISPKYSSNMEGEGQGWEVGEGGLKLYLHTANPM